MCCTRPRPSGRTSSSCTSPPKPSSPCASVSPPYNARPSLAVPTLPLPLSLSLPPQAGGRKPRWRARSSERGGKTVRARSELSPAARTASIIAGLDALGAFRSKWLTIFAASAKPAIIIPPSPRFVLPYLIQELPRASRDRRSCLLSSLLARVPSLPRRLASCRSPGSRPPPSRCPAPPMTLFRTCSAARS